MNYSGLDRSRRHLQGSSRSTSGRSPEAKQKNQLPPSARIARYASTTPSDVEVHQWNNFLNVVGRINRFSGRAYALGSVHITYVSANNIREMLNERFPEAYANQRRAHQLVKKLRREFNHFTHQPEERQIVSSVFEDIDLDDDDGYGSIAPSSDPITYDAQKWHDGRFKLTGEGIFGRNRNKLGLVPDTDTRTLLSEAQSCISFLRDFGLNTARLRPDPVLHAVIFESFQTIPPDHGVLYPEEWPLHMSFDAPKVHTSPNM